MKHGSLFSGIGGFDLAAKWMGWENLFHCEWNKFGQKVLNHYWPDAELFTDITKSDFTKYANQIDVLSGGFPCQPYSHAGKRLGKEDDRHLWPEMLRAIREIQPTWVVGENVSGLISWNGGLVFEEVQTDLEAEGYEVFPVVLPACSVNAPHRRDRAWFIAYRNSAPTKYSISARRNLFAGALQKDTTNADSNGQQRSNGQHEINAGETGEYAQRDFEPVVTSDTASDRRERNGQGIGIEKGLQPRSEPTGQLARGFKGLCGDGDAANAMCIGQPGKEHRQTESGQHSQFSQINGWDNFPTQPPVCGRNDGISNRLDGITFSKWRNESIKAYGNAIVPQVAFQIFKAIQEMENSFLCK